MEDLTANPLDTLREKLRAVDRSVEEGETRLKEIGALRKRVAADRETLDSQLKSTARDTTKQGGTARVAELEESLFTKNEELRALALQREATEQEIELAREADRLRASLKTVETLTKPTLRGCSKASPRSAMTRRPTFRPRLSPTTSSRTLRSAKARSNFRS